ncbi:hypothetical protein SAMN05421539_12036 [Jannaschia seohaensis]|uniref:Uncharacterized protein n=1 Tax=Jannaschia seohaensis TaxID=475081 RepID=A0A2Y9C963_9RHOB|nr:hypothetical protein BCF38_12036 [Jannaschia seohaensis]SSA51493.1 hypothetical protein SAMN05421539_12036 [Jannaschia seohaensis]
MDGDILVVAPGRASVAVRSPGFDYYGSRKVGTQLTEQVAIYAGWSAFWRLAAPRQGVARVGTSAAQAA